MLSKISLTYISLVWELWGEEDKAYAGEAYRGGVPGTYLTILHTNQPETETKKENYLHELPGYLNSYVDYV